MKPIRLMAMTMKPAPLRTALLLLMAGITMPLSACASGGSEAAEAADAVVTVRQGDEVHRFTVEVARTSEEQARGLMNRTSLAADRGMLFPFAKPKYAT